MKKSLLLLTLIALCFQVKAQEQNKQCSKEEFRAKKEAYLCKQAGLSQEEASKFFPVYFELQDLKKQVNKNVWKNARKCKESETSETAYEEILNGFMDASDENNRLDKEYFKKFQEILSNKKIYLVLKAEIKFNRNMLKIMQQDKRD